MAALQDIQDTIGRAAETVGPAVVGLGRGWGLGSGVVIDKGRVLSNAHTLRRDEPTVVFADGRREAASIVAADRDLDLAVLDRDTADAPAGAWGAPDELAPRRPALALADPGGRGPPLTHA